MHVLTGIGEPEITAYLAEISNEKNGRAASRPTVNRFVSNEGIRVRVRLWVRVHFRVDTLKIGSFHRKLYIYKKYHGNQKPMWRRGMLLSICKIESSPYH